MEAVLGNPFALALCSFYHVENVVRTITLVQKFHIAFGIHTASQPEIPNKKGCLVRLHLLQEELSELAHGLAANDIIECLDALCDLRYVLDGTVLALGLAGTFSEAFDEVHSSNMSKLDDNGNPIRDPAGRIVKSNNYCPPDLKQFITS